MTYKFAISIRCIKRLRLVLFASALLLFSLLGSIVACTTETPVPPPVDTNVTISLVGRVSDLGSGQPLDNAKVELQYRGTRTAYTDTTGIFTFRFLASTTPDTVRIHVEKHCYQPHDEFVDIPPVTKLPLDIRLQPCFIETDPAEMPSITQSMPTPTLTPTLSPERPIVPPTVIPPTRIPPTIEPSQVPPSAVPTPIPAPTIEPLVATEIPPPPTQTNLPPASKTPRPTATSAVWLKFEWDIQHVCDVDPDVIEIRVHNLNNVEVEVDGYINAKPNGGEEALIAAVKPNERGCPADSWCGPIQRIRDAYPDGFQGIVWGMTTVYYDSKVVAKSTLDSVELTCNPS